jgi:hypothetical protein
MSKALTTPTSDDAMKGAQLTTQYHRATGGMKEVVIFGAMMMQLREEHPESVGAGRPKKLSTRGQLNENEPFTLAKWLETYAPEVKRTTAIRFLHVTEAIAQDYVEIVGAKIAKLMPMSQLVTTALEELPETAQAKQLELFEWINGTSQRSWLDRFNPESPQKRGHKTKIDQGNDTRKPVTAADLAVAAEEEIISILNALDAWFLAAHHTRVKKDTLITTDAVLEEARKKLKTVK